MLIKFLLLLQTVILGLHLLCLPSYGANKQETERILSFHSAIQVFPDATMTVTETITVYSTGNKIKRGIYRDFPTHYKDRHSHNYHVKFEVKAVLRDGKPESYHLEGLSNGTRIYIGRKNVFLNPGRYTYIIKYSTNRQLGFFKDHDELYWNVTGNGWSFLIDKASATVSLLGVSGQVIMEVDAYTGFTGEKGKDFFASTNGAEDVLFYTKRPLKPAEGLTIVVKWPKGHVKEPAIATKVQWFITDNCGVIVGFFGLLILFMYYLMAWLRYGRDPSRGIIIPLYEPPGKLSPAAMRFIVNMRYDDKVFTAAVINMAVKGYLKIHELNDDFILTKTGEGEYLLSREEQTIATKLFAESRSEIKVGIKDRLTFHNGRVELQRSLRDGLERIYFSTNRRFFIVGLIISFLLMIASGVLGVSEGIPETGIMIFWLTGWTFGVAILVRVVIGAWKKVIAGRRQKLVSPIKAVFLSAFAIPFVIAEIGGIVVVAMSASLYVIIILGIMVFINILFYRLLKAPTLAGRKILDKIEGFKMYLSTAEKERLNLLNPPERTPELFEKYLPYAFALGVDQAWSEQFSDVLSRVYAPGTGNTPRWYAGSSWHTSGVSKFTSNLGSSLTSAVSVAAASPSSPGSSSGGGGGGSSGGGGGGGGGGGW